MHKPPIFNDYDANGYRMTITGARSSRTEDDNLLYNLRFRYGALIAFMSDTQVVNCYDEFASTDMFRDNDARFLEFLWEWI